MDRDRFFKWAAAVTFGLMCGSIAPLLARVAFKPFREAGMLPPFHPYIMAALGVAGFVLGLLLLWKEGRKTGGGTAVEQGKGSGPEETPGRNLLLGSAYTRVIAGFAVLLMTVAVGFCANALTNNWRTEGVPFSGVAAVTCTVAADILCILLLLAEGKEQRGQRFPDLPEEAWDEAKKDFEEFERKEKIRKLYEPSVTDEYLRGFANASSFFIRNYLAPKTVGPTETEFLLFVRENDGQGETPLNEAQYASYMVMALMTEFNLSDKDYKAITRMAPHEDSRKLLASIPFHPVFVQEGVDQARDQFKNLGNETE